LVSRPLYFDRQPPTRGFAIWRDRIWAELWIIGQLLNNLPGDINTDYRHIAKPLVRCKRIDQPSLLTNMTTENLLFKAIKTRSEFLIKRGSEWKKEISSAKNYVGTPDLKHWTFGKSAGLNGQYHANGGAAKKWLYSMGFVNILQLPDGKFKKGIQNAFLRWASNVEGFDIVRKFEKDQGNNKRFEILIHSTLIPASLLYKTTISSTNQDFFDEGFKKEITREVFSRNRKVTELAKKKHGTVCSACGFSFSTAYGTHGSGFIEMHHLYPINLGKRATEINDLAPLCSNCHRMVHKGDRLLTIKELIGIIKEAKLKS
jgi:hypothetical protein